MIQLYGRFTGCLSHSQVSRGLAGALRAAGLEPQLHNVEDTNPPLAPLPELGFYVGGYPPFAEPWLRPHARRAALFITESSVIPAAWAAIAASLDLVAVPSRWVADVYAGAGVPRAKLVVAPHGLHEAFRALAPDRPPLREPLRLLHVAGAASFLDRKGTPQLVEAFRKVFRPGEAQLTLRTPMTPYVQSLVGAERGRGATVLVHGLDRPEHQTFGGLAPEEMRELIDDCDLLVQPSRAEAFGMVPLEARARGVPVLLTYCTGHEEHARADDFVVEHGAESKITVNGIPNGRAPSVSVEQVASGLRYAARCLREGVEMPAPCAWAAWRAAWSWERQSEALVERLRRLV